MIDNNNISDLSLDSISEKSIEDYNIFDDTKIIISDENLKNIEEKINNENSYNNMDNENNKNPNFQINNINLNDRKIIILKKKKNININFVSYKRTSNNFNNSAFTPIKSNINNIIPKKNVLNLLDIIKNENKEKNDKTKNFLGKKRYLFKVDKPNDFKIFTAGGNGNFSDKIIKEVIQNFNKRICNKSNAESEKIKKYALKVQNVQTRKDNSDNIRKKIKSRFIKCLRKTVNERLTNAGSKELFKLLPQIFISNISKEKNKIYLNLSFKDLFSKNFYEEEKININEFNLDNYNHNLSVLDYLEKNDVINEKSNYKNFKNMKLYEIFNEYLKSNEFENEITSLKNKNETDKYIKDYILKASNLIDFFLN